MAFAETIITNYLNKITNYLTKTHLINIQKIFVLILVKSILSLYDIYFVRYKYYIIFILVPRKTSYFDQTCNEFISDWVVMACLGPKPIKVLFFFGHTKKKKIKKIKSKYYLRMELINHKSAETYAITQRTSSKVTFLILVLYDFIVQDILSSLLLLCYNLMIMNDYE